MSELEQVERALEPVMAWYQPLEGDPRPLHEVVGAVVKDLLEARASQAEAEKDSRRLDYLDTLRKDPHLRGGQMDGLPLHLWAVAAATLPPATGAPSVREALDRGIEIRRKRKA